MADTDKNIYSLVLSDDVIDEIDSMARSAGLSRSAMVNQILAEKTRCITPEMRVKQITNAIREAGRRRVLPSAAALTGDSRVQDGAEVPL